MSLSIDRGRQAAIGSSQSHAFERCGNLPNQNGTIARASIDQSSQFATILGKVLLPVLALDPYATHRTLIPAGRLQRLAHVTGGTRLRRDDYQDDLGRTDEFAQGRSCVPISLSVQLTAAPEGDSTLLQSRLEVGDDRLLRISVGRSEKDEWRGKRGECVRATAQ